MIDEQLLDGLHDALGEVIADERRQWQRERALIEAQAQTSIERLYAATMRRAPISSTQPRRQLARSSRW